MNYKFNVTYYNKIFAVPKELVEKHIKLAGPVQLKALLWILSHPDDECDENVLSKALGISPIDISDAMQYWISCGMINSATEAVKTPAPTKSDKPKAEPKSVEKPTKSVQRLTRAEANLAIKKSKELEWLVKEAQMKLGKTLSATDQTVIVSLNTQVGLPCEVIAMLLEFCASRAKRNTNYIETIGVDWAAKDIDTVEKAEKHLKSIELTDGYWRKIQSAFGLEFRSPSEREKLYAAKWLGEWHFSSKMLKKAYDICIDNTGKFSVSYINTIITAWHDHDIKTPEQADEANLTFKAKKNKSSAKKGVADIPEDMLDEIFKLDNPD